jgi:hypothetical protein
MLGKEYYLIMLLVGNYDDSKSIASRGNITPSCPIALSIIDHQHQKH